MNEQVTAAVIHDLDSLSSADLVARWQYCQQQLDLLRDTSLPQSFDILEESRTTGDGSNV